MAFIRKAGQALETPGYSSGSGMLGGAQTGLKQSTDAGTPGGWTNIQDYLSANQGSTTNIDTAKNQTAKKIQEGAKSIQEQKSNASPLPTPTAYSEEAQNQALQNDDYGVFNQGLSQQNAQDQMSLVPDVNQTIYGNQPLEQRVNEISNLDPTNFDKTMSFVGGLAEGNPNYTAGAKAFDSMLLQGNQDFRQNFIPQVQEQYNTMYTQPLEQARAERTQQMADAQAAIEAAKGGWQTGINQYLGSQDQAMKDILAQQQAQEAQAADLTFNEWLPLYNAANPAPAGEDPMATPAYLMDGYNYLDHAQRTGNVGPSMDTAAYQYGPEKLADYNALSELINQYGGSYNQLTPTQGYNPGQWAFKGD